MSLASPVGHPAQSLVERPGALIALQHPQGHCVHAAVEKTARGRSEQRSPDARPLLLWMHIQALNLSHFVLAVETAILGPAVLTQPQDLPTVDGGENRTSSCVLEADDLAPVASCVLGETPCIPRL